VRTLQTQADWCNRAQWVLGLSLAAMVAAFYSFVYRPNSQRLDDLRDQIASKQTSLMSNKARAEVLPSVLAAVYAMKSRLEQFDKRIPSNPEPGAFINDITELSDQSGLKSKWNVEPGMPQQGERFAEWPITLKFEGNFLNVCRFLSRAELMTRLTRVKGLKIHSADAGKSGVVQVELSLNIYYAEG
jgi:Tfp pilus assembly protein PilO